MTRDTFDLFTEQQAPRARFGDSDSLHKEEARKSDLIDLDLPYCGTRALSLVVHKPGDPAKKWIFLALSQIEFEMKSKFEVHVTLPEWLAKEKGLI